MISRRQLLNQSIRWGAAALFGRAEAQPRKLKVIVTGGHPGDPEYGCGGTIARYSDQGHDVVLLYLNEGDTRCPETSVSGSTGVRVAEAKRACEILKARPLYAGQCDAHAVVDAVHYEAFRMLIQAEQPDVLFTHWPIDNHADHRAMSMLSYDAWLQMKRAFAFYYYEVSAGEDTEMFTPTDYVNIEATEARKRAACFAHASQSPERYYALQSQVMRMRGVESKHAQAEGFIRHVQSRNGLLPGGRLRE